MSVSRRRPGLLGLLLASSLALSCGGSGGSEPAADVTADAAADVASDTTADTGPTCAYTGRHMLAGPCEDDFDQALEAKATRYERTWHLFNAAGIGVNTDVSVAGPGTPERALVDEFITQHDGWEAEFEAFAGTTAAELITTNHKVAGLYAGVGLCADAYRYGVLRDQGYAAAEVDRARAYLLRGLETLHTAVAITGVEGVIARGLMRVEWWGPGGAPLIPLFDEAGKALPEVKNNGAWRADNSPGGDYPDLVWEDSVSRDQLVGWVAAFGCAWEVLAEDAAVDDAVKDTLQADAKALGQALMVVRESGYDLEVPDADGRTTLHGWLNEKNLDGQVYSSAVENGFHAVMALGIVATYAFVSGDAEMAAWLQDDLIADRELPRIVRENIADLNDFGLGSNFSNYNMTFMGFWLAFRYLEDAEARALLQTAVDVEVYARPGRDFQPVEMGYSFYDFTFAAGTAGARAGADTPGPWDDSAIARGVDTLTRFREPPYWTFEMMNCPLLETFDCKAQRNSKGNCQWDKTLLADPCIASDGVTELVMTGCDAWKCTESVATAVPWELKPPSNYHWRSAPHEPNGGSEGPGLLPGVDFRWAYWLGRWTRR